MTNVNPDVSNIQKYVDWSKVAASGRRLGACKATEGLSFNDQYFKYNWQGMLDNKMMRIAYHYAHPVNDPVQEFNHFANMVPLFEVGFGTTIALDLELDQGLSPVQYQSYALTWGRLARDHYGVQPGLYTGAYFLHKNLNNSNLKDLFWLWEAAYQSNSPDPSPWSKWTMWQFTDAGIVPGISGKCDLSVGVPDFYNIKPAPVTQEVVMARVPNAVAACSIPGVVDGTWVVASDGGVFTFGPGPFHGSVPELKIQLHASIIKIVAHGQGGYWLVAADGGIFAFGDAPALNVYTPLIHEYDLGVHAIVDAELAPSGDHLLLLADDGSHYEIVPA